MMSLSGNLPETLQRLFFSVRANSTRSGRSTLRGKLGKGSLKGLRDRKRFERSAGARSCVHARAYLPAKQKHHHHHHHHHQHQHQHLLYHLQRHVTTAQPLWQTAKALDYLTTNVATPPWKSRYSATRRLVDERQSPQEALPIEPTNVLKKTTHRQTRRTEMHTLPHPITP